MWSGSHQAGPGAHWQVWAAALAGGEPADPAEPTRASGSGEPDWVDLAGNPPGIGITHEAARRRQTEGVGADRSWRVGADGEFAVADLLATLAAVSRWNRLRGRTQLWRVLHSVPLGDGHGHASGDVDHLLVGPPGLVSINTKHHRTGKLYLDGDQLVLNGHRTDYVPKARREADRVTRLLQATLAAHGHIELAGRVSVRPLLVIVGGRLMTDRWPAGVTVVMTSTLIHAVRAFPTALDPDEVAAVYELARRSTTWNPPTPPPAALAAPPPPSAGAAATGRGPGAATSDHQKPGEKPDDKERAAAHPTARASLKPRPLQAADRLAAAPARPGEASRGHPPPPRLARRSAMTRER